MDYVTPMHIALATPLAIAAIYECLKVKQKLNEEPRRVKLSPGRHSEAFYYAFIYPNTIQPFPENNHHEQEITQQSKKTSTRPMILLIPMAIVFLLIGLPRIIYKLANRKPRK